MQFEPLNSLVLLERAEREKLNPDKLCSFGIHVLDDALYRIFPNDLIVIGADSGVGKSSLIMDIAMHNAKNGKTVGLFYLEGGHNEAIQRMKWRMICGKYYKNKDHKTFIDMDYTHWRANDPSMAGLKQIEMDVEKEINEIFKKNFFIYDMTQNLYAPDQERVGYDKIYSGLMDFFDGTEFGKIKYNLDLLIIDHLHYFDFEDGTRGSDSEKITKAMRVCKEVSDIYKVPIILVSHLRKKEKDRGLPDQEHFHGSSNIPKISTDTIVISPAYGLQNNADLVYPTFFRFIKSRRGLKSNYAALVNYYLEENSYGKHYKIHAVNEHGKPEAEPLAVNKLPKWYKHRKEGDTENENKWDN